MTKRERRYLKIYYKDMLDLDKALTGGGPELENALYNTFSFKWYLLFIEFTLLKKTIWRIIKRHNKESKEFYKNFDKYGV